MDTSTQSTSPLQLSVAQRGFMTMQNKIRDWGVDQIMQATGKNPAEAEAEFTKMVNDGARRVRENQLRTEAREIVENNSTIQVASRSSAELKTLAQLISDETKIQRAAAKANMPWYVEVSNFLEHPIDNTLNAGKNAAINKFKEALGFNADGEGGFMTQMMQAVQNNPGKSALAAMTTGAILKSFLSGDENDNGSFMGSLGKAGVFVALALFLGKLLIDFAYSNAKTEADWRAVADPLKSAVNTVSGALGFETPPALDAILKLDKESMAKFSITDAAAAAKEATNQVPDAQAQQFAEGISKIATAQPERQLSPAEVAARHSGVVGEVGLINARTETAPQATDDATQPSNVLNTLKKVANTTVMRTVAPQQRIGLDVMEQILSTRAGSTVAKSVAAVAAPELSAVTGPVIDKLSADAKENKAHATAAKKQATSANKFGVSAADVVAVGGQITTGLVQPDLSTATVGPQAAARKSQRTM